MKIEDKQLLLKDLSARLPYGVKIRMIHHEIKGADPEYVDDVFSTTHYNMIDYDDDNYEFIPYLRPLSSMTEEECEEYRKFSYYGAAGMRDSDFTEMVAVPSFEKMDYLNSHHFDYRGLIEKGLAIEVTKDNNPYEN